MKNIIKRIARPVANLFVRASSSLSERIDWRVEEVFQRNLFDATNLKGVFVPIDDEASSHILLKRHFNSLGQDETGFPIPLDLGGGATSLLERGEHDALKIRRSLFEKAGTGGRRFLEFGCGTGRLLRWFRDLAESNEFWGVDLCEKYIKWLQQEFSPPFRFAACTTQPNLPFEDNYFDAVYAGSVFTHIYDLADTWYLELRRITKPGGLILITVHDDVTIRSLMNESPPSQLAAQLRQFDLETGVLKKEFNMFTISRRPQGAQVFHNREYLSRHLASFFDVLEWRDNQYGIQSSVLLRKPEATPPPRF